MSSLKECCVLDHLNFSIILSMTSATLSFSDIVDLRLPVFTGTTRDQTDG